MIYRQMIEALYKKYRECSGVSTDTRSIENGNIFFALKGPNFNANRFSGDALRAGAAYAVIDDPDCAVNENCILVDNVLKTLQQLAGFHRKKLNIPFIGITGSNGKTTTKELVKTVLSRMFRTWATRGNLNNHIGVPLTILNVKQGTEIAIIEMGANSIGEIAGLCRIAEPTHGMITNIGKAHTEGFGGYEGVLRAKSELFDWLLKSKGIPFINSNDPVLFNMSKRFEKVILFPRKENYYHCSMENIYPTITIKSESGKIFKTNLIGAYNFPNIASALCIGKFFGVPESEAGQAVADYNPSNNRSQLIKKGNITIILDAYNANPSSMEAALENIINMPILKKNLILGDMFELGEFMEEEHRNIGKMTKNKNFNKVIFCGERMKYAYEENKDAIYCRNLNELEDYLDESDLSDSVLLIKGSRAMQLETIVNKING